MISLVRKTLTAYLKEKRIITQAELDTNELRYANTKEALFITLYLDGKVIASAGRIQIQKENTLFECIDLSLQLLKDPRFSATLQSPDMLEKIRIRTDRITANSRRLIKNISELNTRTEGVILLSQNLGILSVVLPRMISYNPTPERYFEFACRKVNIDPKTLSPSDYVIYALSSEEENDF